MDNIVFITGTEYCLIVTLGIIRQYFSNGSYHNIIYRLSSIEKRRLNNINLDGIDVEYRELIYDYSNPTKELKDVLDNIIKLNPVKFFYFFENKFWLNYLLSKLHKNGTTIILAPDGMKAYDNKEYWTLRQKARMFLDGLKHSAKAHMLPIMPFVERTYATSRYIDEVWVEYPKYYNNITKKRVVEFHYSVDIDFINLLMRVFNANENDFETIKNNATILFLDSSYNSKDYYDRTLKILNQLKAKFPSRKILIKFHPLTAKDAKSAFSMMHNLYEVNSTYPAELYLASAKDTIVVSMVSTSELFYNPNCLYYWIYKLYPNASYYDTMKNPTDYIRVVTDVNQIGEVVL